MLTVSLNRTVMKLKTILLVAALAVAAAAQNSTQTAPIATELNKPSGVFWNEEITGTPGNLANSLLVNSVIGLNLTKRFFLEAGVPFYYIQSSAKTGAGSAPGNPYLGFGLNSSVPYADLTTTITASAPVASKNKGFSTGHVTWSMENYFEHDLVLLAPFLDVTVGNTVPDTRHFIRPFSSFGYNADVSGGVTYKLTKLLGIGGSGYDVAPWGNQSIFSRNHVKGSSGKGNAGNNRGFNTSSVLSGSSATSAVKDYGASLWAQVQPKRSIGLQLGYTRSANYSANAVTFDLTFDMLPLLFKR
jgi:hypothetical protein